MINKGTGGSDVPILLESMRWYGPEDEVPLAFIRQAGATAVFSALHAIPYGEIWPRQEIRARKAMIEEAGLTWAAVESLPVHEDIKSGASGCDRYIENYQESLRNLAAEGIDLVVYNFMPVLDWIRTDLRLKMPDGSESLSYDPAQFAAFEIFALERPGAANDYSQEQLTLARTWWQSLSALERDNFVLGIIDVFPGCKLGLSLSHIREMLSKYQHISSDQLKSNLRTFLRSVIPVAEEVGVRLAIHPDDPPYSVLGLPRIASSEADLDEVLGMAPSKSNGICFCTGSLGIRPETDLPAMVSKFGPSIFAVHLRNTIVEPDGSFRESSHLGGDVDMAGVVAELLIELDRRAASNIPNNLPFRPDHGLRMMDDLTKDSEIAPGYSCIGRMKGLAELRGLIRGLQFNRAHVPVGTDPFTAVFG